MNPTESEEILKTINAALKSRKLYPPGHPAINTPAVKTHELLGGALQTKGTIAIGMVHEALVFEGDPIENSEKLYPDLIEYMTDKNVDAIIFEKGFAIEEITGLFDILSGEQVQGEGLEKALKEKGVTRITLKSIPVGHRNVLEIYNGAIDAVKNVMSEVRMGKIPRSEPVKNIVAEIADSVLDDPNAMLGLTMIKNYDDYLFNHSVNVSVLALSLARTMNLAPNDLHDVGVAALLHDVGKTGVSEDIIRKPGGLSSEEWEKVKEHPVMGANIVKRMDGIEEHISTMVLEHHVKQDHSGYPKTEAQLHPYSQILTICDAYDALTTLRVYQTPNNPVEAVKIMMNLSGRHFDPDTLKSFLDMVGLYPVGTMVRLSSNEISIVTKVFPDKPISPTVKIIYDKDGNTLDDQIDLDLSTVEDVHIIATVNPATANVELANFFKKEAS
jgi:putative nucleotidyltransferase with HDIG domain